MPEAWRSTATALRGEASSGKVCCILGGGLCGLACAVEFSKRGYAVVIVDEGTPGSAAASSAAALLDPLTPKGKLMWKGKEAWIAASRLLSEAWAQTQGAQIQPQERPLSPFFVETGSLHIPTSSKHAKALRSAAEELQASEDAGWLGVSYLLAGAEQHSAVAAAEMSAEDGEEEPPAAASTLEELACGVHAPDGALYCKAAIVVDSARYLSGLWALVQSSTPSKWVRQRVSDAYLLAEAFDCVVIAAGAGVTSIAEGRHLPIDPCRGQVLDFEWHATRAYANCAESSTFEATTTDGADALSVALSRLRVALTGGVYVLPMAAEQRLVCGATHEQQQQQQQLGRLPAALGSSGGSRLANAPDVSTADALLRPALLSMYPPLQAAGPPLCARAGVRALPPRNELGALPLAGRAHTSHSNVWLVGGMGARGLLYHAVVAEWLVGAVVQEAGGSPRSGKGIAGSGQSLLPSELRRGEFAAVLSSRLVRLEDASKRAALPACLEPT
jgi:glycine/D-amino acid oxidase-like deaminating enzyme